MAAEWVKVLLDALEEGDKEARQEKSSFQGSNISIAQNNPFIKFLCALTEWDAPSGTLKHHV